jgi:hypothetical protein
MFIGIVLKDFNYNQPVESSSVFVKKMAMMLVKYDVYMSWGDRCEESRLPDAELSHMCTNMCGWDQLIRTEAGEDPPHIAGDLQGLGVERKAEGLKEYTKTCQGLLEEIDLSATYTLCFWGVSQLLDVKNWRFIFKQSSWIGATVPMARFFEEWPIHTVMYELEPGHDGKHLESRKRYYMDYIVWSSTVPAVADNEAFTSAYTFCDSPATFDEFSTLGNVELEKEHNHDDVRKGRIGGWFSRKASRNTNGTNGTPMEHTWKKASSSSTPRDAHQCQAAEDDDSDALSFASCFSELDEEEVAPRGIGSWFTSWRPNPSGGTGAKHDAENGVAVNSTLLKRRESPLKR